MNASAEKGGIFTISRRQWLILLMVQLANMLFGMTITLANLVLPQMRGNLSATQEEISWVITLNLVATAVATPMTGWLSSRLGWRNLMFFTVLGFTATSLLCGLANSLETLILARVAQGAFGAPIMPLGQAILLATFPKHLQPTALVMWGIGAVFGPVLGPILGSIVTEAYDWRAAFFMIVPPGICTLLCIWLALRDYTARTSVKFDWIGFIALSVAMAAAQLVLDRGHRLDWFESTQMILFAFTGALALWIFVVHCLTVADPFLNPRLLLDRNFSIGVARQFAAFLAHPRFERSDQWRGLFPANGEPPIGRQTVDGALDLEQGVDPLDSFQRGRRDGSGCAAARLASGTGLDIGEDEELAAGMALMWSST